MTDDSTETLAQKRKRQSDEIHAALGRYIEAFEEIVSWIRVACISVTSLAADRNKQSQNHRLMSLVFNHRSMTADNLVSIYRSMVGEIIRDKETTIESSERKIIEGVIKQFNKDFSAATATRNDYIHATWQIGQGNKATEDWSSIGFTRGKATSDGLQFVDGPKTSTDIDKMTKECKDLSRFILQFHGCFMSTLAHLPVRVSSIFSLDGKGESKRWIVKVRGS